MTIEDFRAMADNKTVELENGLLLSRDDMYNLYLSSNENDESFIEIGNLQGK